MTTNGDAERDALKSGDVGRLGWMALALTPEMGPTRIARAMERLATGGAGRDLNETGHNSNRTSAGILRGGAGV